MDMSGYSVKCTFWGRQADEFNETNAVIAFKGVKVSDYNGRSLGASDTTSIEVNPDLPEAHRLRGWYDATGHAMLFESFAGANSGAKGDTVVKTIAQIEDEGLGHGDKVIYSLHSPIILHLLQLLYMCEVKMVLGTQRVPILLDAIRKSWR